MPDKERIMVISHGHPAVSPGGGENAAYALFRGVRANPHGEGLSVGRDSPTPDVEALCVAREAPSPNQGSVLGQASDDGSEVVLRTDIEFFRFSQRHRR